MRALIAAFVLIVAGLAWPSARAEVPHPPVEAYGELPGIRTFALSPDGAHAAFFARRNGKDLVVLYTRETGKVSGLVSVDNIAARELFFADNKHLILVASDTARRVGFRGKWEDSAAFSINIETGRRETLLRGSEGIFPAQTGLGDVVGRYTKKSKLFMPAFYGDSWEDPEYHVFEVDLNTGKGRIFKKGLTYTRDWFLDEDGTVLAREDYSNNRDIYQIWTYVSGKRKLIYETESEQPPFSLIGTKPDKSALIVVDESDTFEGFTAVYEMDFDGNVSARVFARDDADIEDIYTDTNRVVQGVRYSGNLPTYEFYDPKINAAVQAMMDKFPGAEIIPVAWSKGWKEIIYSVFRGDTAGSYVLQDRTDGSFKVLAIAREDIPAAALGEVGAITYPARDGLTIPGILTWPAGISDEARTNLPLVVLPHGGPASYDSLRFDWMAQYFANRGYLVLQPNFRGSSGYGGEFERAGYGEWGGKMQDDITDGIHALVNSNMADPGRVCIVGASYGGYAALAGGAFTPDLYKCVVAIAPVSDVSRMIHEEGIQHGRRHWVVDYWKDVIGDPSEERAKLKQISPVHSADTFQAPVLLIHGKDDTVVPVSQSRIMESALKKAGKDVTLIEMKGEDHWLSDGDTRIEALRATADFVDRYIGQN